MVTIGIDPGTAITGYGLVAETSSGGLQAVAYGAVTTSSKMEMSERLVIIFEELTKIVEEYQPVYSAVEKLFFQKNVRTAISVGQARGVAILTLAKAGLPVSEYTPLEIKQAVTGYGGADKQQMQAMVKALLGLDEIPQPDDAADALAVAICHLHSRKMENLYE